MMEEGKKINFYRLGLENGRRYRMELTDEYRLTGTGGGVNPRTAIGQREDGAVLLLIIDGRQTHSLGATLNDLINVFLDFDAVNAANLDGGGSTVFYYGGEIYNKISSIYGARGIPTAIVIR